MEPQHTYMLVDQGRDAGHSSVLHRMSGGAQNVDRSVHGSAERKGSMATALPNVCFSNAGLYQRMVYLLYS